MGVVVTAVLDDQLKPQYTVVEVAAASWTMADANLQLWIGDSTIYTKTEEFNKLYSCLEVIREGDNETPTSPAESYAEVATNFKKDVSAAFNATAKGVDETFVGIWYGSLFQSTPGGSITPYVTQAIEKYMEDSAKK